MAPSQPNHDRPLQEFSQWLTHEAPVLCSETTRSGEASSTSDTPVFVPQSRIDEYFQPNRVSRLLHALFPDRDRPNAQDIAQRCPRGLCILLSIGSAKYINTFASSPELWDDQLPFWRPGPIEFPVALEDPEFFERFFQAQWRFCPNKLERLESGAFKVKRERVLPLLKKRWLARGATASLHHIVVHPDYDRLRDYEGNTPSHHEYALKTYHGSHAEHYYRTEVRNFAELTFSRTDPTPGLIGFYGGFEHGEKFNIVLEYANGGTLEDVFQTWEPPSCGAEIITFWTAFADILKALGSIHELKRDEGDVKGYSVLQGWHQDIKPRNILVVDRDRSSPFGCQYKLADLGLSHFERVSGHESDATAIDTMGTRTYGAPELHRRSEFDETRQQPATRKIDIWSLGCVMLEACIWIIRGRAYLAKFRESRTKENDMRNSTAGDCFHDGKRPKPSPLQCVKDELIYLSSERRVSDFITGPILMVVQRMLRSFQKERPSAEEIRADIENALVAAETQQKQHYQARPDALASSTTHRGMSSRPETAASSTWARPDHLTHAPSSPAVAFQLPSDRAVFTDEGLFASPRGTVVYDEPTRLQSQSTPPAINGPSPPRTPIARMPPLRDTTDALLVRSQSARGSHGVASTYAAWTGYDEPGGSVPPMSVRKRGKSTATSYYSINEALDERPIATSSHVEGAVNTVTNGGLPTQQRQNPQARQEELGRPSNEEGAAPSAASRLTLQNSERPQQKRKKKKTAAPFLSVSSAITWREGQKRMSLFGSKPSLEHERFRSWLDQRDHIFLVDDATSMQPYWRHVKELLEPLTYLVKDGDPDGAELYFTVSTSRKQSKKSSDLVALVGRHQPIGNTDIRHRLGTILQKYCASLRDQVVPAGSWQSRPVARAATIYVLTDGKWAGGTNACDIIEDTLNVLKSLKCDRKQLGIQFISFGQDVDGLKRLEDLDDFGKLAHVELDIVDTEDSQGNVWKMLLGAIDQTFDEEDSDPEEET